MSNRSWDEVKEEFLQVKVAELFVTKKLIVF
jgi:hypothetical protein